MCGIAGFLAHGAGPSRREVLTRMTRTLRHRGPDEEGVVLDGPVGLGARRLRVMDLRTGQQPMAVDDGAVRVVQNGEIYNFRELRGRLERLGHRFRTESDTEVIARAYVEWGDKCVDHLDGMFAFAVWDALQQVLLLARDRMGEKPLYYHAGSEAFVFGSELRALLEHPAVPRELDLRSLSRYLGFEYVPAPDSMLAGIAKLPPGHVLTISAGTKPHVVRYWDLEFAPDHAPTETEWAERLRAQIEDSVRRQLVSDVPLGLFLSGGVDSSAIVSTATRLAGRRLRTFSVGFPEASYDERRFARAVAARCGTDHAELVFSPDLMTESLADVGSLLDEPLVDGSFLPIHALSRLARQHVTVVLSGDGGDELFCGYPTFLAERGVRWVRRLPAGILRAAGWAVNRARSSARYGSAEFLLKQFFRGLPHPPEVRTQLLLGGLTADEQSPLFSDPVRAAVSGFDPYEELGRSVAEVPGLDPIERLIYQHCKFYLADQNLATVDRASMATGLEVRSPFLDRPLVDLASRIPSSLKLHGWRTKHILKRALEPDLPATILDRRKQGFGVPLGAWLAGPLRPVLDDWLAADRLRRVGLFDPSAVRTLVTEHVSGQRDRRKLLWALLMFEAWREHALPGARWT
jgi:asparagine synthase (glutamine-hydrolysing)